MAYRELSRAFGSAAFFLRDCGRTAMDKSGLRLLWGLLRPLLTTATQMPLVGSA
jgi:hypothetical protein